MRNKKHQKTTAHNSETQARNKQPHGMKKAGKAALRAGVLAMQLPITMTATTMAYQQEINPVEAFDDSVDMLQVRFGANFCPPGMSEARAKELFTMINNPGNFDPKVAKAEAERNGLSFADPSAAIAKLEKAQSVEDITAVVNHHTTSNYDITFKASSGDPAFQTTEDTDFYRLDAQNFVFYTSVFPNELIEKMGVDTIEVKTLGDRGGEYYFPSKHMTIDPFNLGYTRTFVHEGLGHGIQYTSCEGYPLNDSAFTASNPGDFSYIGNSWETADITPEHRSKLKHVYDPYGLKNSREDYASTIEAFLGSTLAPEPIIYDTARTQKLIVTLDRMDELAPGSAAYLSSIRSSLRTFYGYEEFGLNTNSDVTVPQHIPMSVAPVHSKDNYTYYDPNIDSHHPAD